MFTVSVVDVIEFAQLLVLRLLERVISNFVELFGYSKLFPH